MMRDYELTDEEYMTIMDALRYARDNAIHSESRAAFSNAQTTLIQQRDDSE